MPGVHETQRDAADQAGGEGDGGGHEEVPHVRGGVQVRDGQALVGAGVVAGEGGVQPPELPDPGRAVDTWGVAAALSKRTGLMIYFNEQGHFLIFVLNFIVLSF